VQTQTRRHSFLVSLIGIKRVVVAINKMDLVGYSQDVRRASSRLPRIRPRRSAWRTSSRIPMSALRGDNITDSERHALVHGPTLMGYLETVEIDRSAA
jgi:bifunctional enzyme CysN/CysC